MRAPEHVWWWKLVIGVLGISSAAASAQPPFVTVYRQPIVLNEDTSWCWFQDERAILHREKIWLGGVSSQGDITVTVYDLATQQASVHILHPQLETDDHNAPALLVLPDGRVLAAYTKHGTDRFSRFRVTKGPGEPSEWEPEQLFEHPAGATYSNLCFLRDEGPLGRVYNFVRADQWDPNVMISDDLGRSWLLLGRLVDGGSPRVRPYVKYKGNDRDTIHFVMSEGHPNSMNTSLFHGMVRRGKLCRSDGTVVCEDPFRGQVPPPTAFTRIFLAGQDQAAWPADLELDANGRPSVVYSVILDPVPRQTGRRGLNHAYRFARWDGQKWVDFHLAFAGSRLYPAEPEYTGLAAIHPRDPNIVVISTNSDPVTGEPLLVGGKRRWELFLGHSMDAGASWRWQPLTSNSEEDNLRPIIVAEPEVWVVIWLQGTYESYTKYRQKALALVFASS